MPESNESTNRTPEETDSSLSFYPDRVEESSDSSTEDLMSDVALVRLYKVKNMKEAFEHAKNNPAYYDINGQVLSVVELQQADGSFKQTLVNHDLGGSTGLAKFWNGLGAYLPEDKTKFDYNKNALLNISNQRHSIKDIHHIMFRVVWRLVNRLSDEQLLFKKQEAFDQIYRALNQFINKDIAAFFSQADISGDTDTIIEKINTHIDERLPAYDKQAKDLAGRVLGEHSIKLVSRDDGIHALKHKTAIDMDALESCQVSQLVIHTKGIEQSSESKKISPSATVPQQKYKFREVVGDHAQENPKPLRSQSRNPSFAHVKHLREQVTLADGNVKGVGDSLTVREQVDDYMHRTIQKRKNNIEAVSGSVLDDNELESVEAQAPSQAESNKPVVYNLLTSLSAHNDQVGTAREIFQAMHVYNKTIYKLHVENKTDPKLIDQSGPAFYVMNVPVNQWGDRLMLKPGWRGVVGMYDGLSKEAAFFTDLAMLETLPKEMRPQDFDKMMTEIKTFYAKFLHKTSFEPGWASGFWKFLGRNVSYFSKSQYWGQTVRQLHELNKKVDASVKGYQANTDEARLKKAYAILHRAAMGHEGFAEQKQYGSIIQGMFLAANDNDNLKGCKSAVDRYGFVENLGNCLLGYIAGREVVGELDKGDDGAMRRELTSAINIFLDGGSAVEKFDIKTFAESVHNTRDKYVAYEIGKAAEYNDANDSKNINGDSHDSSPLKSQWFSKKPGDWIPSFNGTNEFVPGRLASNNQQKSAPKIQAKKSAESTYDTVRASYEPQVLRDSWIAKLQKYASSWSFRKHHKDQVKATIRVLKSLDGTNLTADQVDNELTSLRGKVSKEGFNAKGAMAKMLGMSSCFYQPVAQSDGVQQQLRQNTTPVNGG